MKLWIMNFVNRKQIHFTHSKKFFVIFKHYVSGLNQFHTIKANCFLKYSLATKFSIFLVHFLFLATNVLSFINENVLLICGLSYGKIFVLQFAKNILHRKSFYPILKILCFACSISRTDNILKILIKRCLKRANC